MRKLKYYVACSVDGFIAHTDGSFDGFSFEGEAINDYIESLNNFDVVLMGRKTYEVGLKEGKTNPYPMMKSYVFSRTMGVSPDENVVVMADDLYPLVQQLKQEPGKDIYLCGGADLASQLFSEHLVDELILKLNPFLMGTGIALFAQVIPQTPLTLIHHKIYGNGLVLLHYQVMGRDSA